MVSVQMYKKKKLKPIAAVAFLSMILSVFLITSCKETPDTTLEVTVVNVNGTILSDAKVWLVAEPTDTAHNPIAVKDSALTDASGKAYFNLSSFYKPGQIGVMQIKVKGFYFGLTGEALAEITEEQRNQVLLQIQ
ncbi:MAG: hypothetical protein ACK5BW_02325 [Flavobacteriia bacterium]|jgi:hypothetical protein